MTAHAAGASHPCLLTPHPRRLPACLPATPCVCRATDDRLREQLERPHLLLQRLQRRLLVCVPHGWPAWLGGPRLGVVWWHPARPGISAAAPDPPPLLTLLPHLCPPLLPALQPRCSSTCECSGARFGQPTRAPNKAQPTLGAAQRSEGRGGLPAPPWHAPPPWQTACPPAPCARRYNYNGAVPESWYPYTSGDTGTYTTCKTPVGTAPSALPFPSFELTTLGAQGYAGYSQAAATHTDIMAKLAANSPIVIYVRRLRRRRGSRGVVAEGAEGRQRRPWPRPPSPHTCCGAAPAAGVPPRR